MIREREKGRYANGGVERKLGMKEREREKREVYAHVNLLSQLYIAPHSFLY